jgi:hypothetical protein
MRLELTPRTYASGTYYRVQLQFACTYYRVQLQFACTYYHVQLLLLWQWAHTVVLPKSRALSFERNDP